MRTVFAAQGKSHIVDIEGAAYVPGKFYTTEEGAKLNRIVKKQKPAELHPELEELNAKEQELRQKGLTIPKELVEKRKRINREMHEKQV